MQESRCCRLDDAADAKGDKAGIDPHNFAVVSAYPLHQALAQVSERQDSVQVIGGNGNIGDFPGDFRSVTDSDSHIRGGKRR